MRFNNYLQENINENLVTKCLTKIKNKSDNILKKLFLDKWKELTQYLKDNNLENDALKIINKHMKTGFSSLDIITKTNIKESKEINEDLKHWWMFVKSEAFPALSFYPVLKCFLELDKLITDPGSADIKTMIIYGVMWVFLVSGKYLTDWSKWKKEKPSEYKAEKYVKTI